MVTNRAVALRGPHNRVGTLVDGTAHHDIRGGNHLLDELHRYRHGRRDSTCDRPVLRGM